MFTWPRDVRFGLRNRSPKTSALDRTPQHGRSLIKNEFPKYGTMVGSSFRTATLIPIVNGHPNAREPCPQW